MELKDIDPVGVIVQDGKDHGLIESEVLQGVSMLPIGTKLYTAEQMQEYAKAKAFEVAEELLEPERSRNELIEMIFKEAHDEEV